MFWDVYFGVVAGGVTLFAGFLLFAHFGRSTFKG